MKKVSLGKWEPKMKLYMCLIWVLTAYVAIAALFSDSLQRHWNYGKVAIVLLALFGALLGTIGNVIASRKSKNDNDKMDYL